MAGAVVVERGWEGGGNPLCHNAQTDDTQAEVAVSAMMLVAV